MNLLHTVVDMGIEQIRTITIPVQDQDRAKSFYLDVLGFAERFDRSTGEHHWLGSVEES